MLADAADPCCSPTHGRISGAHTPRTASAEPKSSNPVSSRVRNLQRDLSLQISRNNGTRLDTFDNQAAINRPTKSVLGECLISRAAVRSAGFLERGKFGNDHAFGFRSFQRHMLPLCGQNSDRASFQCRGGFVPAGLPLPKRATGFELRIFRYGKEFRRLTRTIKNVLEDEVKMVLKLWGFVPR